MNGQCPRCREPFRQDDVFCEACGYRLPDPRSPTSMRRTPVGGPVLAPTQGCVACEHPMIDDDGFCQRCGRQQPLARDRMSYDLDLVCGASDRGLVRDHNADAMAFGLAGLPGRPRTVVAAVCDGVGSTAMSDKAAQVAADAAVDELLDGAVNGVRPRLLAATSKAAEAVVALSGVEKPSTTFLSAVITAREVTIAWLGDSRAYWIAGDGSRGEQATDRSSVTGSTCLTIDHTARNALLTDEASAAHTLTRWIGADSTDLRPQVVTVTPTQPGTVVLCTDGLWGYLKEPEMLATYILGSRSTADAVSGLVDAAKAHGGRDNITIVAVPFPPAQERP